VNKLVNSPPFANIFEQGTKKIPEVEKSHETIPFYVISVLLESTIALKK
jgi:hypothetical protein